MLEAVDWGTLCDILGIYDDKMSELKDTYPEERVRIERAINFWLTNDPLASWRRVVQGLYDEGEDALGDSLRHWCEDLTGMCVHTTPHY